jgi:hypothetical protein
VDGQNKWHPGAAIAGLIIALGIFMLLGYLGFVGN